MVCASDAKAQCLLSVWISGLRLTKVANALDVQA